MVTYTPEQILQATLPSCIFTKDKIRNEWKSLLKVYHPDVYKGNNANLLTHKINELYNLGLKQISDGIWEEKDVMRFTPVDSSAITIKYRLCRDFELGKVYIGNTIVAYLINKGHKSFYDNTVKTVGNFRYENDRMREKMELYLPKIKKACVLTSGDFLIVFSKTEEVICMRDALEYFNNKTDPRHVAWMLTRLYNLTCYFEYLGISHNALTVDNCFISPEYHSVIPIGGWWYSSKIGEKLLGVPKEVYNVMSPKVKDRKVGNISIDLESIKLVGRTMLGDKNGARLRVMSEIPAAFSSWLRDVSPNSAVGEYSSWSKILDKIYGERKFIKLVLTPDQIYKK